MIYKSTVLFGAIACLLQLAFADAVVEAKVIPYPRVPDHRANSDFPSVKVNGVLIDTVSTDMNVGYTHFAFSGTVDEDGYGSRMPVFELCVINSYDFLRASSKEVHCCSGSDGTEKRQKEVDCTGGRVSTVDRRLGLVVKGRYLGVGPQWSVHPALNRALSWSAYFTRTVLVIGRSGESVLSTDEIESEHGAFFPLMGHRY